MSETDALVVSHEERLQRSETFASEVAGQMAAMSEQLRQVGEKVTEVGASLKSDIASFRETNNEDHETIKHEVEALKAKSLEHDQKFVLLLGDRELREKRIRNAKKAGFAVLLTLLGGIATRWGEVISNWLSGVHKL
ncbi:MAG: hypothetical protein EPO08_21010 [Rhodospirillaceae bacterium]|nr:MAG: hypothetical protein EPO08_21010 [Rhodospirillaceae bacterium]